MWWYTWYDCTAQESARVDKREFIKSILSTCIQTETNRRSSKVHTTNVPALFDEFSSLEGSEYKHGDRARNLPETAHSTRRSNLESEDDVISPKKTIDDPRGELLRKSAEAKNYNDDADSDKVVSTVSWLVSINIFDESVCETANITCVPNLRWKTSYLKILFHALANGISLRFLSTCDFQEHWCYL